MAPCQTEAKGNEHETARTEAPENEAPGSDVGSPGQHNRVRRGTRRSACRLFSGRKSGDPHFAGFSAARGEAFHRQSFAGGKADTPACTSCHANDPRKSGQTPAGKAIDPVALSASPGRYADPAKVEKWFKRNCNDVLGRQCTAQEKGDWLSFMISQ